MHIRWGALGKVRQLDQRHPYLHEERAATFLDPTTGQFDLATVVKISQALFGEIVLDRLIERLMVIAVEHAGAVRGLLLLPQAEELRIEAEAATGHDAVQVCLRQASATSAELPESILRYVVRTQESVILDDAVSANHFSTDDYIHRKRPRSVLCLPLVKQTRLAGVLYLENNLSSHVFTSARIAVLQLLASQAAISLENAQAQEELQRRETDLRKAQAELAHVTRVTTMGELAASIAHEVSQPIAGVMLNGTSCLRWLDRINEDSANLAEAREALHRIIRDGSRARDVIARIRTLFKKAETSKELLDLNEAIREVVVLTRSEMDKKGVACGWSWRSNSLLSSGTECNCSR